LCPVNAWAPVPTAHVSKHAYTCCFSPQGEDELKEVRTFTDLVHSKNRCVTDCVLSMHTYRAAHAARVSAARAAARCAFAPSPSPPHLLSNEAALLTALACTAAVCARVCACVTCSALRHHTHCAASSHCNALCLRRWQGPERCGVGAAAARHGGGVAGAQPDLRRARQAQRPGEAHRLPLQLQQLRQLHV
jgi:hypothetical protein